MCHHLIWTFWHTSLPTTCIRMVLGMGLGIPLRMCVSWTQFDHSSYDESVQWTSWWIVTILLRMKNFFSASMTKVTRKQFTRHNTNRYHHGYPSFIFFYGSDFRPFGRLGPITTKKADLSLSLACPTNLWARQQHLNFNNVLRICTVWHVDIRFMNDLYQARNNA